VPDGDADAGCRHRAGVGDPDPLDAGEEAGEAARRHRRLGLEALLAVDSEVSLTPHMQISWDTAVLCEMTISALGQKVTCL